MNYSNKTIRNIAAYLLQIILERLTAPRTVFSKLAILSLTLSGAVLITPFWQQAIETLLEVTIKAEYTPISPWVTGPLFLSLTFIFAYFSHRLRPQAGAEVLIDTPVIHKVGTIGRSQVFSYCGSVRDLSDVDVVVTSEDRELDLGSRSGTSVSGRIRHMAAEFDSAGNLTKDHLSEHMLSWKNRKGGPGPYNLGTCVVAPSFRAKKFGIKEIVHAVALDKKGSGQNSIEEEAIRNIIDFALMRCAKKNYQSIFIPVFGLGSGGISSKDAVRKTLDPLTKRLQTADHPMKVYIGTYRINDSLMAITRALSDIR